MVQIIPTLFATNEADYKKRIDRVLASSFLKDCWVQIDLMDGKFVQNEGVSLSIVKKYPIPRRKEAQLMVVDPEEWISGLIEVGVDRIIFPIEIDKDIPDLLNRIKKSGIEVGLSLNPETEVEQLEKYTENLNATLLMGVKPGLEEQHLDPHTERKIRYIKERGWQVKIGVDGGVNNTNAKELVDAGVDYLAVGSYLFEGDIDENLENLWEAINSG